LVWTTLGDRRLPTHVRDLILSGADGLSISAVTAWEFTELELRGRLPEELTLEEVVRGLSVTVLDLPAQVWTVAKKLPPLHRDPIDRMMIAHAILAQLPIVTSDATMRRYPVQSLW
jgi:PIN domain nuclease of toxin-antitoxin system